MRTDVLLLGVDGGGTGCRARLTDLAGRVLGSGEAGPANIRIGRDAAFAAVLEAAGRCMAEAGATYEQHRVVACLALAGIGDLGEPRTAHSFVHPFARITCTSDAHAACIGAHAGQDGGILIVGTGSVGWAVIEGRDHRVGGWGFPVSDEGSGAWLGCEAVRRLLWAHDGLIAWSPLLRSLYEEFGGNAQAIVRWMTQANPRDFGRFARQIVVHEKGGDPQALELMQIAGGHISALGRRLIEIGVTRLSVMGGLAAAMEPHLGAEVKAVLVPPQGDALAGALRLAAREAEDLAPAESGEMR